MIRLIQTMVAGLQRRIANMVVRVVVDSADDSKKLQLLKLKLLADETKDGVERFQDYGFTSVPEEGAEGLVLCIGGRRDQPVAFVVDDRRYRPRNLQSGEVAMYDKSGSLIVFKANGDIELTPSSGVLRFTGDLEVDGAVSATGNVAADGDVTAGAISLSGHTHSAGGYTAPQDAGSVTGSSGGPS